jgi:hypothetical protein
LAWGCQVGIIKQWFLNHGVHHSLSSGLQGGPGETVIAVTDKGGNPILIRLLLCLRGQPWGSCFYMGTSVLMLRPAVSLHGSWNPRLLQV